VSRRGRGGRKLSGSGHFSQVCSGHAGVLRWALAPVCFACRGDRDVFKATARLYDAKRKVMGEHTALGSTIILAS
jgi:hypothetical protein